MSSPCPSPPRFRELFWYWLKLGIISFGGPAGQIAMMHQELVEKRRLLSEQRFLHALNYCMVLPGPDAQQLAIYLGWLLHRSWGGIVVGTLFLLPSLFILAGLSYVYLVWGDVPLVQGVFAGIKPAVVAVVLFAAWRLGGRVLKNPALWALALLAFVAIFVFAVPFPYIVIAAALLGALGGRLMPHWFAIAGGHQAAQEAGAPALFDDDTPPPPHARFRPRRLLALVGLFVALWAVAMWLLPTGILQQMGGFFSKAALVTFGGAYAVLPYVYQGGVEQYQWLSAGQMMDGLALGESTPGPLIMVVAFIGFLGGWQGEVFGPQMLVWGGIAGALVATFFTFLPGYLFILAGAPLVESTHGELRFTALLSAISAAVVEVIFNLALFLGWHVLWPAAVSTAPFAGGFAWFDALLALLAFVALWRLKLGIMTVVGAGALIGLVLALL